MGQITSFFRQIFHHRRIIVMSDHATHHLSVSGKRQLGMFAALLFVVGFTSFSTGSYVTAKQKISEQGETIKSVTNARVDASFNYVPSLTGKGFELRAAQPIVQLEPIDALTGMEKTMLIGHISQLKAANQELMQTVRETTKGEIKSLEKILAKTGIGNQLMSGIPRVKASKMATLELSKSTGAQGGPYIPEYEEGRWDAAMQAFTVELESSVLRLKALRRLTESLPLAKPMRRASLESRFGRRIDPFRKRLAFHSGLDFSGAIGSKILATSAGKVVHAGRKGAYGNLVEIDHGHGITTRYAHLSKVHVRVGQQVATGKVIGRQGTTGRSTGQHLHYEVRYQGKALNPANFLAAGKSYVLQ